MNAERRARLADISTLLRLSTELLESDDVSRHWPCRSLCEVAYRLLVKVQKEEEQRRGRVPMGFRGEEKRFYDCFMMADEHLSEAVRALALALASPAKWAERGSEESRALITQAHDAVKKTER